MFIIHAASQILLGLVYCVFGWMVRHLLLIVNVDSQHIDSLKILSLTL